MAWGVNPGFVEIEPDVYLNMAKVVMLRLDSEKMCAVFVLENGETIESVSPYPDVMNRIFSS